MSNRQLPFHPTIAEAETQLRPTQRHQPRAAPALWSRNWTPACSFGRQPRRTNDEQRKQDGERCRRRISLRDECAEERNEHSKPKACLLYTSDAADDLLCVD